MLTSIFEMVVTTVTAATMAVGGAACDAGTFVADTAVYVADVTTCATCDVADAVGDFFYDLFTDEKEITFAYAVDEDGFVHPVKEIEVNPIQVEEILVEETQVEEIQVEEIQPEVILFEDCATYWPD